MEVNEEDENANTCDCFLDAREDRVYEVVECLLHEMGQRYMIELGKTKTVFSQT